MAIVSTCETDSGATSTRSTSFSGPGYGLWNTCAARLKMTVHARCSRGTNHNEYSPAFSAWPSINTSWSNETRVAESAPGCQTLSHGTSFPNNARPRVTGRPYSTEMVVNATVCVTLPR